MYEHITIHRFRLFRDVHVDGLRRINLLTGTNNSGKTALLEALLLLSGGANGELPLRLNRIRGLAASGTIRQVANALFGPLFPNLDTADPVVIEGRHSDFGRVKVTLSLRDSETTSLPLEPAQHAEEDLQHVSLHLTFARDSAPQQEVEVKCTPNGFEMQPPPADAPLLCSILTSKTGNAEEDAGRYSRLRVRKQGDVLLEALQIIEPRLEQIEVNSASGRSILCGDIGLPELLPLGLMGEGMSRVARLILAIADSPGGVVLVDEIENGVHHSVLPGVWRAVDEAAVRARTQVFATTHSFECVQAASAMIGEGLGLYRLQPDVASRPIVDYPTEALEGALENGIEVR